MGRLDKLKKKSAARTEAMDEAQNRITAQTIVKRVNDVEPERLDLNMIVANPDNELYRTDAMDVDSDIRVMETMLRRDTASAADDFGLGGAAVQRQSEEE